MKSSMFFSRRAWRPAAGESSWQVWVIEAAVRLRQFLVTQPAALHVYLRHPVVLACRRRAHGRHDGRPAAGRA